jgi:tetratricopeptide (TPR) repeat protein
MHERVVSERERVLGVDHPDTVTAQERLARELAGRGRYEEAVTLYRRVVSERERVLGVEHPDTSTARENLGVALASLGRYDEAVILFRRVVSERERILGVDHPDTSTARYNLAIALFHVDRRTARRELRRALSDALRAVGEGHPIVPDARVRLRRRQSLIEIAIGLIFALLVVWLVQPVNGLLALLAGAVIVATVVVVVCYRSYKAITAGLSIEQLHALVNRNYQMLTTRPGRRDV